jgi:cation transport regulator ChaC
VVHGVLYDLSPEEMAYLDTIEDVPQGHYYRQTVAVVDEKGRILQAEVYRTTHPAGPFTPTRRYVGLMLKGAREHGLDPAYIRTLEDLYASLPA